MIKLLGKLGLWLCMFLIFVNPVNAGSDDSNIREVGVEWVEDYSDTDQSNLFNAKEDAESFYNALGNIGWTKRFNLGNSLAWESDFEKSSVGGSDSTYIDSLDFAYFSGHGSRDAFFLGSNHDGDGSYTYQVHYSEANWGDLDLEWIALSACEVLNCNSLSDLFDRWGWPVFKGLHMILGYDTKSYDRVMGDRFVYYMTNGGKTIKDAWIQANVDIQPSDVYVAYLAVCENEYDYLPGYGSVGSDYDSPSCLVWGKTQC